MRAPRTTPSAAAHAAGAVVVGAAIAVDPGGWFPFGPTKWLAASVAVAAAVTVTAWEGGRPRLPRRFVAIGAALLAWTVLAAAFGRDPLYAWTGTPERHLGVLAWLLFAAAVGASFDRRSIGRWTRWCTAAAAWCGAYAVVE